MFLNPFHIPTAFAQIKTAATNTSSEAASLVELAVNFFIEQLPRWIAAVIIVLMSFVIAKLIKNIVESKMAENGIEEEHQEISILAGRTAHASILIIGITVGLKIGGIDLTTIIAAVAFGIGFALRDLIMNFLAGGMILLSRQFTIGDFIKVNDTIGKVMEIQTRATILKALDGTKIIVPNADLFTNQVISFTSNPFRRIEVVVGVEYDTNLQIALETIDKVLKTTEGILLEPKSAILLSEFGDSSINIIVRFWVESRGGWLQIKSNVIKNMKKAFDEVGIGIPFPIRTVYQAHERDAEAFQSTQEANYNQHYANKPNLPQKSAPPGTEPTPSPIEPPTQEAAPAPQSPAVATPQSEPAPTEQAIVQSPAPAAAQEAVPASTAPQPVAAPTMQATAQEAAPAAPTPEVVPTPIPTEASPEQAPAQSPAPAATPPPAAQ